MSTVYLDGSYLPKAEARVSVDDRGFLFSDGVYEVTAAYGGRLFRFEKHLERMRSGLAALRIDFDPSELRQIKEELLARNGLAEAEAAYVYVQVTRGAAPRSHAFPRVDATPTVYAFANRYERPERDRWEKGFRAITVPDMRWARVDIKAISLLPNVLAQQAAVDAGVDDAIYVRDGIAMEGAHNNLFAVFEGMVVTAPKSNYILHGISRDVVIGLAHDLGIPVEERSIPVGDLYQADEIFFTGTTTEVRPTVEVDGRRIGDGTVGPVSTRLFDAFLAATVSQGVEAASA
ncbi:MAG: D-amino acid aminotransferase [Gemmatimonadota bacterium]|nr:D-amino acid aminotransferase [Gemmatimonadota bacterium]